MTAERGSLATSSPSADTARLLPLRPFPGGDADIRHERLSLGLYAGTTEACAVAVVRRLALIASFVALVTAIAWLALESAAMADDWSAAVDPDQIGAVLTDTAFGRCGRCTLRSAAALVAVVALGPRARWAATSIVSGALLASLGLVGHAAMQTRRRRRPASREPRRPSLGGGRMDRRPRSFRDVPSRL